MSLVTSTRMLRTAQKDGYAVGSFNIENMEMAQAVIEAAEESHAPVIVQTSPSTLGYASSTVFYSMVKAMVKNVSVPVALHLDHGNSYRLVINAINDGYTSVMIDGSHLPFEENIALTYEVVQFAGKKNIPVEAELGIVGGKEDDTIKEGNIFTDPYKAKEFVESTNVSSLAVAIGTTHGLYKSTPKLDLLRLQAIRKMVEVPLVLHGASGLSDNDVIQCVNEGICKVNYATDLRISFTNHIRNILQDRPGIIDPKIFGKSARESVKDLVKRIMKVCGCVDRY